MSPDVAPAPLADLARRLDRLERQNRRYRAALIGIAAVCACVALGGWTARGPAQKLTASELTIVDEAGNMRAVLGYDAREGTRFVLSSPRKDAAGQQLSTGFAVGLGPNDDAPFLILANERRMVLHVRYNELGLPQLALGGAGTLRTLLGTDETGSAGLLVLDTAGGIAAGVSATTQGRRAMLLARGDTLLWRAP
jgi:hypothetical protein